MTFLTSSNLPEEPGSSIPHVSGLWSNQLESSVLIKNDIMEIIY